MVVAKRSLEVFGELEVWIDGRYRCAERGSRAWERSVWSTLRRRRGDVRRIERRSPERSSRSRRTVAGERRVSAQPGITERVRQVDERRRASEVAESAAQLIALLAADVPIESGARRDLGLVRHVVGRAIVIRQN